MKLGKITLKLSKTSWLILSVGVFMVAVVGLGLTISQQNKEQSQLNEELSVAELRLDKLDVKQLRQQHNELQVQLEESSAQFEAAKEGMRQTVESIDVTDEFFEIARLCGVQITSISNSSIKSETLNNIACSMITLGAVVKGKVPNIIDFITKLNNDYTTGLVGSVQISIPEAADENESTVNIQMVVYAYLGD